MTSPAKAKTRTTPKKVKVTGVKAKKAKEAPINLRAHAYQRDLIDRAAALKNVPRTEFMLEAATRAAEDVLLDQRLLMLPRAQFAAFERALEAPIADIGALTTLLAKPAPWEH